MDRRKLDIDDERRLVAIEAALSALSKEVSNLRTSVEGLVEAWQATTWLLRAVKGLGAVAAAVTAIYAAVKWKWW